MSWAYAPSLPRSESMIILVPFTVTLPEERVNTYLLGSQNFSSVTALDNGGWVVTWYEQLSSDPRVTKGLISQIHDSTGTPAAAETILEYAVDVEVTAGHAVAALPNGGWTAVYYDGDVKQMVFAKGYQLFGEVRTVNTDPASVSFGVPSVTVLADGGWVVAWGADRGGDQGLDIYQRQFGSDGVPVGDAEKVNASANYYEVDPVLTALPDGGWIIAWASGGDAAFQRYDASGARVGDQVQANSDDWFSHSDLDVTSLVYGGWVVTWTSNGSKSYMGTDQIYQQRYDADGEAVGGTLRVNGAKSLFSQDDSTVVALQDGGWLVLWTAETGSSVQGDLMARRFAIDGTALGDSFAVNTPRSESLDPWEGDFSWLGDAAQLDGGEIVLTFTRETADTSGPEVYQTILRPTPVTYGEETAESRVGGEGNEILFLKGGNDWYDGSLGGDDYVDGGIGNDSIYAGAGNDTLLGGAGNDYIYSAGGADLVRLGSGHDIFRSGGGGHDTVYGQSGNDELDGNAGNDKLIGGTGQDTLFGRAGNDSLVGGRGADALYGNEGRDTISAGSGDDLLSGGAGNDLLKGGRDADTFVFEAASGVSDVSDLTFAVETVNGADSLRITANGGSVLLLGIIDDNPSHGHLEFV
ncbi:calcium-binding protein [Donghicola mangrovi]|uniref:Calcium-binding protein n=1 Tax=Donghicola mangrovi TaxID=2729614 RepID=A0A850QD62_9RHOB|nr:calcium-binding protein [Donghicola mangrovi]NVO24365.1 calcium-binding protein [Donghicola mangrovi]